MRQTALALALAASPLAAEAPRLDMPVDCTLGETCYIQNYVDTLPAKSRAADFACGPLTYDGHKGTDFALSTLAEMNKGVAVLAAANGIVRGTRDGMPDTGLEGEIDGKECGNGVLIDHGQGWATQYCHMKRGSVSVRKGDVVKAGDSLGQIGFSGKTEFPHLHIALRHKGKVIDPFDPQNTATCGPSEDALWTFPTDYNEVGLLGAGFAAEVPAFDAVKAGTAGSVTLLETAPALVLWGYLYGAREGDVISLSIAGPEGFTFSSAVTAKRTQALSMRAAGKRLRAPAWPAGRYTGTVTLTRKGKELSRKTTELEITP